MSKYGFEYNMIYTVSSSSEITEIIKAIESEFLMNDIFSISPKKDLQLMRIEHAKMLLLQNRYTVSEVALMTGYTNPYHFIRQFKELCGETPKKWKG